MYTHIYIYAYANTCDAYIKCTLHKYKHILPCTHIHTYSYAHTCAHLYTYLHVFYMYTKTHTFVWMKEEDSFDTCSMASRELNPLWIMRNVTPVVQDMGGGGGRWGVSTICMYQLIWNHMTYILSLFITLHTHSLSLTHTVILSHTHTLSLSLSQTPTHNVRAKNSPPCSAEDSRCVNMAALEACTTSSSESNAAYAAACLIAIAFDMPVCDVTHFSAWHNPYLWKRRDSFV